MGDMMLRRVEMVDVITCNAAISACEKGARWHEALGILSDMRLRRLELDVITYNAAISACGKGARWHEALVMLSDMRLGHMVPNVISCNAVISACERALGGTRHFACSRSCGC